MKAVIIQRAVYEVTLNSIELRTICNAISATLDELGWEFSIRVGEQPEVARAMLNDLRRALDSRTQG